MERTILKLIILTGMIMPMSGFAVTDAEIDAEFAKKPGFVGGTINESSSYKPEIYQSIKNNAARLGGVAAAVEDYHQGMKSNLMPHEIMKLHDNEMKPADLVAIRKARPGTDINTVIAQKQTGKSTPEVKKYVGDLGVEKQYKNMEDLLADRPINSKGAATLFEGAGMSDDQITDAIVKKFGYQIFQISKDEVYKAVKKQATDQKALDGLMDELAEGFKQNVTPALTMKLKANGIAMKDWKELAMLDPKKVLLDDVIAMKKQGKSIDEIKKGLKTEKK